MMIKKIETLKINYKLAILTVFGAVFISLSLIESFRDKQMSTQAFVGSMIAVVGLCIIFLGASVYYSSEKEGDYYISNTSNKMSIRELLEKKCPFLR